MKKFFLLTILLLPLITPKHARATAVAWDGGGDGSSWADGTNWDGDSTPTDADDVTIDINGVTVNLATSTTINSLTLGNSGGTNTVTLNFSYDAITSGALIIDAGDLTVYSGANITHSAGTSSIVGKANIDIQTGSAIITGSVDVSTKGYTQSEGPGTGADVGGSGGASHGGKGGAGYGNINGGGAIYGSLTAPTTLGSGGGDAGPSGKGGKGGGAIKINANTTITVNGSINANGGNYQDGQYDPGGGSGGSVYLTAPTINGGGSITSNGGAGDSAGGGGGGGGRISLNYTSYGFTGTLTAYGAGPSSRYGGAGTIYLKPTGEDADILFDNNDQNTLNDSYQGHSFLDDGTYDNITIKNYARLVIENSSSIAYSTLDWSTKGIIEDNGGTFDLVSGGGSLTVPSTSYLYANTARTFTGLTVNGTLTHSKNISDPVYRIDFTINGNTTVDSGGSIYLKELGFNSASGPGAGTSGSGSGGAGHGGIGATSNTSRAGGPAYGSLSQPITLGSGGGNGNSPGGHGGGAVKINTSGTTTIDGSINVDGGNYLGVSYDPGGGSGGSVFLITDTFAGGAGGSITAEGGNGDGGGGAGAGGRIAIYYSSANTYSGSTSVISGTTWGTAEQGTLLIKATSGELTSSPFDTGDPDTLIYNLTWTETLGTGEDAKFQLRTAPDSTGSPGTWTSWLGPSGAGTYYTDPTGVSESINSANSDASNDQWVQYKVFFSATTDSETIPTISDITLTYVVNSTPTATITNSPTQDSAGELDLTYTLSDPEESTLTTFLAADVGATTNSDYVQASTANLTISDASAFPSSGTIALDNELITYTGKSGNDLTGITRGTNTTTDVTHSSGASVFLIATGVTGDIGAGQSQIGTKTVTWTPATDLTDLETTTATLKIIANDGNLANQIGSDTVNSITLDTKSPIGGDIFINNRTNKLTFSASDGNGIYYKASNNSGLTADGVNPDSGNWVTYTTPIDWTFPVDAATTYVRFKDAYGNETATYSTTGPAKMTTFLIQDASNPDTSDWRLFISWPVVAEPAAGFAYYQIYRSTDNINFSPYSQVTTRSENYLVDTNLDNATTYYYKGTVVDNHGNETDYNDQGSAGSASKSGVGLTPDGSGGGDFTTPVISAISTTDLTTNSVTLTWTTDELSNSTIGYSTDTGYATEKGSISMTTSHSVELNNLTPATKYYYRIISSDAVNNKATVEDSSTYFFTTLSDTTGPTISNIQAAVGETSAGITWATNEDSDSLVEFSTDTSYSESSSSATLVRGHALTISDLTNSTTYNYRVTSEDTYGNSSTSPSYTFTTSSVSTGDTTAPSISNIGVGNITATGATVSWETNEAADGKVEYGESTSYERGIAEGNHTYTTSKSVNLIGLSPETTYHYQIQVVDEAGNTNTSSDATFTTGAQSTIDELSNSGSSYGISAPSITSESPAVTDITGTTATLSWVTNKKANSEVYYKIKNSLGAPLNTSAIAYVTSHSIGLTNLAPATTYEYQVKSTDVNGSYVTSSKYEFTTTLPGVASVRVTAKNESSATIEWTTGTPTTTILEYTNTDTRQSKTYTNSSLVTAHLVTLNELIPSTPYVFEVIISDEAGNLARSDQYSFVTNQDTEGPTISAVNNRSTIIAGQNKVQTVITWVTNEPTTSQVEYSLGSGAGDYEQATEINSDFVSNHIMVIANLKPGSVYRYRVKSSDRAENEAVSDPFVLLTPLREVSALDLIIQNLEGAFGWLGNIRR